jgi:hypothetical protein
MFLDAATPTDVLTVLLLYQDIRLHIHDHRSVLGPSKALEVVHGHAVNHAHLPGMWQVSAGDILQQLQKTNGRIMGPGTCYLHPHIQPCSHFHVPKAP